MTNKQPAKKEQGTPKDVFEHLLATVTLAMSVVAFTTIWWQVINIQLPDPLSYYYTNSIELIRGAIAALFVAWPIYLFLGTTISRGIHKNPDKQNIRVRKWLIYLTLFVASIAMIVDLVTIINSFLGGELTLRFALKLLVVLISAGSVFGYYLWDVRRESEKSKIPLATAIATTIAVVAALVFGFIQIGSPAHQRDVRLDQQRVNDLSTLQYNALNIYETTKKLPENTQEMIDAGWTIPSDPENAMAYEYRKTGATSFEVCATFSTTTGDTATLDATTPYREYGFLTVTDWTHAEGHTCFSRTIDPSVLTPKTP